ARPEPDPAEVTHGPAPPDRADHHPARDRPGLPVLPPVGVPPGRRGRAAPGGRAHPAAPGRVPVGLGVRPGPGRPVSAPALPGCPAPTRRAVSRPGTGTVVGPPCRASV